MDKQVIWGKGTHPMTCECDECQIIRDTKRKRLIADSVAQKTYEQSIKISDHMRVAGYNYCPYCGEKLR